MRAGLPYAFNLLPDNLLLWHALPIFSNTGRTFRKHLRCAFVGVFMLPPFCVLTAFSSPCSMIVRVSGTRTTSPMAFAVPNAMFFVCCICAVSFVRIQQLVRFCVWLILDSPRLPSATVAFAFFHRLLPPRVPGSGTFGILVPLDMWQNRRDDSHIISLPTYLAHCAFVAYVVFSTYGITPDSL